MKLDPTFLIVDAGPPAFGKTELMVAAIQNHSYVAGPGRRCVVWLAGCHRRCPGCFQPQYFAFDNGEQYGVEELTARILSVDGIDGVTFSGGEPFEQSLALAEVCRSLKASSDLSILSYTGYRLEWLRDHGEQFGELLDMIDILIDGEYREDEAGTYLWRGSRNQRIIFLSADIKADYPGSSSVAPQEIQLTVTPSRFVLTGFPDEESSRSFQAALKKKGIMVSRTSKDQGNDG